MKRRVAVFKSPAGLFTTVFDVPEGTPDKDAIGDYARVSEFVDIEFPNRDADGAMQAQLSILDSAEWKAREEFDAKIRRIEDARRSLLALTQDVAA